MLIKVPKQAGGVPSGGTTGQVLAKASNTDNDVGWVAASGLPVIATNTTLTVGASGTYTTVNDALTYLRGYRIASGYYVYLQFVNTTVTETAPVLWDHPDSQQIWITNSTPLSLHTWRLVSGSISGYVASIPDWGAVTRAYLTPGLFIPPTCRLNLGIPGSTTLWKLTKSPTDAATNTTVVVNLGDFITTTETTSVTLSAEIGAGVNAAGYLGLGGSLGAGQVVLETSLDAGTKFFSRNQKVHLDILENKHNIADTDGNYYYKMYFEACEVFIKELGTVVNPYGYFIMVRGCTYNIWRHRLTVKKNGFWIHGCFGAMDEAIYVAYEDLPASPDTAFGFVEKGDLVVGSADYDMSVYVGASPVGWGVVSNTASIKFGSITFTGGAGVGATTYAVRGSNGTRLESANSTAAGGFVTANFSNLTSTWSSNGVLFYA